MTHRRLNPVHSHELFDFPHICPRICLLIAALVAIVVATSTFTTARAYAQEARQAATTAPAARATPPQPNGSAASGPSATRVAASEAAGHAQGDASIAGTVTDSSGAVLSGVEVTLTDSRTGVERRATTDAQGTFTLASLPAASYTLTAARAGFEPARVEGLALGAGERRALPLRLVVATLSDSVAVVGGERVPTRGDGAMRTDTPLIETPQAVSIITSEQIQAQGAQTMQDVVRYAPGVRAEAYGLDNRGDWFTLRGGSEGSTVIDGLRQVLSGWWGNVRNEPFAFDRVEVVRGPASVMFGQNGPGGLVNLVTKLPQAESRREIAVQFGNFDHRQIAADFTGRLNDSGTLLYRFVTLVKDSGTQVNLADEERQYVAPSIAWKPNDTTALTLYAHFQRDESNNHVGFWPWEGTLLPAPNGRIPVDTFIGEPDWDGYGGRRVRVGYQLTHKLTDRWKLRHDLRYDHVDGHLDAMYADFGRGLLEDGRSVNRIWYSSYSDTRLANTDVLAEGRYTLGATEHTLLFGVDGVWSRNVIQDVGGEATPFDPYDPTYGTFPLPERDFGPEIPTRTRQVGLIAQDQIKIDQRWIVVLGTRRDYASTDVEGSPESGSDDAAWTRRVGLVFLGNGGLAPYASYSDSFEAVAGMNAYGTPYVPRRGRQVEAGLKWMPDDGRVSLTAAGYELREENRLTTDPQNPLNQLQQGEVTVQGLEVEGTARLRTFNVSANYTYTDAIVTGSSDPDDPYLNHRLPSIPEHSAAIWGVQQFGLGRLQGLSAGLGLRYVGETWDGLDRLRVSSNTLVDALFSIDIGRWRYALNATNLFNRTYIATCLDRGDCWYGSKRRVIGTLTYRP